MYRLIVFCVICTATISISSNLKAREHRSKNNMGFYLSMNEPAPGSVGLNIAYNALSYLRITAGASFYSNASNRIGDEMATTMMSVMGYIFTLGQIKYSKIREFFDDEFDKDKVKYIFARGIGFKFFHPKWKISPSAGISFNKHTSKNHPYDLKDNNSYLTYSLGVDYQMRIGLQFALGVNYSPELPDKAENRVYANLGFFF